jgi:hypothetical protein
VIIGILETAILLDRCGIGQMQVIARIHEAIDEPVPIIGGFDYQTLDVRMIRG